MTAPVGPLKDRCNSVCLQVGMTIGLRVWDTGGGGRGGEVWGGMGNDVGRVEWCVVG